MRKWCEHCGDRFQPKYPTMKLCYACWQKRETAFAEYDLLMRELDTLRRQLVREERKADIPPDILSKMLLLSHPDKHNNSTIANEVTRWLLEQRKENAT